MSRVDWTAGAGPRVGWRTSAAATRPARAATFTCVKDVRRAPDDTTLVVLLVVILPVGTWAASQRAGWRKPSGQAAADFLRQ